MINLGGLNNSLGDLYAGEIANNSRTKGEKGIPGRQKAQEAKGTGLKTDSYEPSKAKEASGADKVAQTTSVWQKNESNLSAKAQAYLKNLREANDEFDFFVANGDEETNGALASGSKEYGVAFSNEELEKMADDEEYAQKMLDGIGMAMEMADRINEGLDLEGKGVSFNRIDVTIGDDGSMSIFAELEKSGEKQKEQIENARKQRAEERKAAAEEQKASLKAKSEEKTEKEEAVARKDPSEGERPGTKASVMRRFNNAYGMKPAQAAGAKGAPGADARRADAYGANDILRTKVSADSEEDLMDKIAHLDWNKVATDQKTQEQLPRFDSAV